MEYASKIIGIGHYIPEREVSNDNVLELLRKSSSLYLTPEELEVLMQKAGRNLERTGSRVRYWCDEDQFCTDIARIASQGALEDAGLDPDEIDLIIFTGMSKALVEPATAHILQYELGANNANVIDTQDACSSFLKSIHIADSLIRTGTYRTILIACGERTYDWADFQCKTVSELDWKFGSMTIGDAAGAMILQATDEPLYRENPHHMLFAFKGDGGGYVHCNIGLNYKIGERYRLQSHSRKLFSSALKQLSVIVEETEWKHIHFDILIAHEIGRLIPDVQIPYFRDAGFDIPDYRFLFPDFGNIASASLPVSMTMAREDGRLKRGHQVLFIGGAAGTQAYGGTFFY